jgi:hypothetical protein
LRRTTHCLALIAVAGTAFAALPAEAHGRHGRWWGGVSIGIGVPLYLGHRVGVWPAYPAPVIVAPPVVYAEPPEPASLPVKSPPEPIFYPARGQSAAQLEADRQECNRWATTQPAALADAGVFHRATLACMDGRGYSAR